MDCSACHSRFGFLQRKRQCAICHRSICTRCSKTLKLSKHTRTYCKACPPSVSGVPESLQTEGQVHSTDPRRDLEERGDFEEREFFGLVELEIIEARGLLAMDANILGMKTSSDPYCVTSVQGECWKDRTRVIPRSLNPKWEEKFYIRVLYPDPVLKFEVYDKDIARSDDFLGSCELDLALCQSGVTYQGWLRLHHPEFTVTGMLRVSVRLHSTALSEVLGYTRKNLKTNNPDPLPIPKFNINSLYGPWMLMIDIMLTRTVLPATWVVLDVVFWVQPNVTVTVIFLWFPLCFFVAYWPSILFLTLAAVMATKNPRWSRVRETREPSWPVTTAEAFIEEDVGPSYKLTLGRFVAQTTTLMPGWLKQFLASLQIPSKSHADSLLYAYDLFHWRYSHSISLYRALLTLAIVALALPFWLFVYLAGMAALLVYSPALCLVRAVVSHLTHKPRTGVAMLAPNFDLTLESRDSQRLIRTLT